MIRPFTAPMRFLFCAAFLVSSVFGMLVPPTEAIAPQPSAHNDTRVPVPQKNINVPKAPVKKAHVQPSTKQVINLSKAERNILARLVYAEARGESFEGQIAIAAVVLNRMQDSHFPDDLNGVVFQENAFSCIQDGKLSTQVNKQAHQAVAAALKGQDPSKDSLYFFNPKTATSTWIWSRPQAVQIGNHIFAK